jgi:GT2 family glycosyltransferase
LKPLGHGQELAAREAAGSLRLLRAPARGQRPGVHGKFFSLGREKLYLRGVTYGTFRPGHRGIDYPDPVAVEHDFERMAATGVNAIRTYTVPPRWLLDAAQRHGLWAMIGLAWEQHVAFLDHDRRAREIEERVRKGVRTCANHPAVLAYVVGNEIPAPVVRWHGYRRVEGFLRRLYSAAKEEDPGSLVTYVNYPPTEYLDLSFVDFFSFNVYLEAQQSLEAYLARLHNIAGDRPIVMAELGLDSRRNGAEAQAQTLQWQVETAFRGGCAGAFVFAWTDEWYVTYLSENGHGTGGTNIEDWDFGLTDRERRPKAALSAVSRAFTQVPAPADLDWPSFSVVVCTHNGERTLRDCLEGLQALDYPDFEVIVVDDGSTDASAAIAEEHGFRVIRTENRGLSNARNTGMKAARGELVAYLDDDAWPDPHWLTYLASTFVNTEHVGVGGPNIAPPSDGPVADCVANAPGGPVHVLLSDAEAEHLPGCNFAFRRSALEAVEGFDPRFRVAGDDVDVCWRLRERGLTLGFNPAAMVWHHRRGSVRAYWRQQAAYGRAEALLEHKWPEKYDAGGNLAWAGRLYGNGVARSLRRGRIYHGMWGKALFQSVYEPAPGVLRMLPSVPEWYLVIALLGSLSALGAIWRPLLVCSPLFLVASGTLVAQAVAGGAKASFPGSKRSTLALLRLLTTLLFLLQPLARLRGRVQQGLTPWRWRGRAGGLSRPVPRTCTLWSERWRSTDERLLEVEAALRTSGAAVLRGSDFDNWDLETRAGALGSARLRMLSEEHGAGRQFVRFRVYPRWSRLGEVLTFSFTILCAVAALDGAWSAATVLGGVAAALVLRALHECGGATAHFALALNERPAEAVGVPATLDRAPAEQA